MTSITSAALVGLFLWTPMASADAASTTPASIGPAYKVSMTGYNAVPEQTSDNPEVTASGAYSNPEIIAARSVDLAEQLPYGTVISVETATSSPTCGYGLVAHKIGLRVIGDLMNARMHKKIDILFDTDDHARVGGKPVNSARVLGHCKNVVIRVVGHVDIKDIPETQDELRLAVGYLPKATDQRLAVSK